MRDGCLLIHKQAGMTSFDVVAKLRRLLSAKTGVAKKALPAMGHGGTLDPFATGLLVVCIGEGTKLSRYFLGSTKEYRGVIRFGQTTVSGDCTEPANETTSTLPASLEVIQQSARSFCASPGNDPYLQIPPMHSAKKVGGQVLHELARKGIEIERKPVPCLIEDFGIESYTPPKATFCVRVSAGTYIRVLAQDLAKRLGSLACLETLERTASGRFKLEDAMTLAQIEACTGSWDGLSAFVPLDRMLDGKPELTLDAEQVKLLRNGRVDFISELKARLMHEFGELGHVVIRNGDGRIVAVFSSEPGVSGFKLDRVFGSYA
jgi:tRNA pseudouridine55 synthase